MTSTTTCDIYDEKFFATYQKTLQQNNNDNNNQNAPMNLQSIRAVQNALQECEQLFIEPSSSTTLTTPELFSVRRQQPSSAKSNFIPTTAEWLSDYASGMKPVRVVGFVQELDTETSLLDSSPKHFARTIVLNGENVQNDEEQQQQVFTECTSLFITPIPGFKYCQEDLQSGNEDQEVSTTASNNNRVSRRNEPTSPLIEKKRTRSEIERDNNRQPHNDQDKQEASKKLRADDENENDDKDEITPSQQNCPTKRNKNDSASSSAAATKTTTLSYGDEDVIRKNEKDNIANRKLWKDLLGLSIAPTHDNLATGVVGLIPHASNNNNNGDEASYSPPSLFGLVECFGFLIPATTKNENENNSNNHESDNNNQQQVIFGGQQDDADFDLMSSSRFHTMPESVCPRLLILSWKSLNSIEEAQEKLSNDNNKHNTNKNEEQQQNVVDQEESKFQTLVSVVAENILSPLQNNASPSSLSAASKALLIHLVSSVIIRNESGAFGDLPFSIEVLEQNNNDEEPSSYSSSKFNSFVALMSALVHSLRPCAVSCDVNYHLLPLPQQQSLSTNNSNMPTTTNHKLQLTHPSSVIARLDYEQQAVSSCVFSLPHGAEMLMIVDDVQHHHQDNRIGNDNETSSKTTTTHKVQQSVFSASTGVSKVIPTPLLQQQQQQEQKAIANYSRNINVISDLIIQQKLPILFGPRCEVSIERNLGMLFLVRTDKDTVGRNTNSNNGRSGSSSSLTGMMQRLSEDSSSTCSSMDDGELLPYLGTEDVFIPLKYRILSENNTSQENNQVVSPKQIQTLIFDQKFNEYFASCRKNYHSCASNYGNNNTNPNYFEDNEKGEGDEYFIKTLNELRSMEPVDVVSRNNNKNYSEKISVWWSTAMIKHSVANVLLTMARARAVLGGRKLVRKSDVDEVRNILIELRRS